jgi:3-hydroxyisobutyrate dehydrogenase-like beta-hydroxyacid dehydrogenase
MNSTLNKIGIIGTGNMGGPMAMRLLDLGAQLTVCDRNPQATAPLAARGAAVVSTPKEVADQADVILASMPSYEASIEVALGAQGIVHGRQAKTYIETSTLGSAAMQKIAAALAAGRRARVPAPCRRWCRGRRTCSSVRVRCSTASPRMCFIWAVSRVDRKS